MSAISNILAVWGQATAEERIEGAEWYPRANAVCQHLALAHCRTLAEVCAIVAVLSPSNRWERNLVDAAMALAADGRGFVSATFGAQRAKAERLLAGRNQGSTAVLPLIGAGLKTRAFYWCLYAPHSAEHVVIDGHAHNIARGKRYPLEQSSVTRAQYGRLVTDYREAARRAGVSPVTLQAATWVTRRRAHGYRPC